MKSTPRAAAHRPDHRYERRVRRKTGRFIAWCRGVEQASADVIASMRESQEAFSALKSEVARFVNGLHVFHRGLNNPQQSANRKEPR
jgi:hypothetical protein